MVSTQIGSLRRFLATNGPRPTAGGGPALLVASGKGGTGTSTLAALLALVGAAEGRRTLIVDANRGLATLHLLLGVAEGPGMGALREGMTPRELMVPVAANLELLTCAAPCEEALSALSDAEWGTLFRRVAATYGEFELVVIDGGSRLDGLRSLGTFGAGRLVAVTASDRISLAATHALVKVCTAQQPGIRTELVVNRCGDAEARATFEVVREGVGRFLARSVEFGGAIPDDPHFGRALGQGQTVQEAARGGGLADAVYELARQITSTGAQAMAAYPQLATR
jgi:flagellar biosynthesis protein FlhG